MHSKNKMILLGWLIISQTATSIAGNESSMRAHIATPEPILPPALPLHEEARNYCALLYGAAQLYTVKLREGKYKSIPQKLVNDISFIKNRFNDLFATLIQHPDVVLQNILFTTAALIDEYPNPLYYDLLEKIAILLSSQKPQLQSPNDYMQWKRNFSWLCGIFMNTVILDSIDQEKKNLYLDYLYELSRSMPRMKHD